MQARLTSRRAFLSTAAFAVTSAYAGRCHLLAQAASQSAELPAVVTQGRAAGAKAKIETKPLRRNVSALMGSGGNIAVLPGKDGKLLIDSGYSTSQVQITTALAGVSNDPMRHLINTHWHFDHTDGNEWMHAAGATILAQDNTKLRLSTPQTMAALHATFAPAPAGALPTETFAETKTVTLNGTTIVLHHYEPAHTDSDISIHFTEADVLHVGDTWFNGFYPFIDYSSNGSIDGMIRAANRTLTVAGPQTIIVPGHGPIGTKAELTEFRDVLAVARDRVAKLKQEGKSLSEVVASKPMASYDATWGAGFMPAQGFLALVYQGV